MFHAWRKTQAKMQSQICDRELQPHPFFAGLVVLAGEFHPIPFRTRPLKPPAPMVLRVNTRESRSSPGQPRTELRKQSRLCESFEKPRAFRAGLFCCAALRKIYAASV